MKTSWVVEKLAMTGRLDFVSKAQLSIYRTFGKTYRDEGTKVGSGRSKMKRILMGRSQCLMETFSPFIDLLPKRGRMFAQSLLF
jgi:hypothetical protein